jgi:hypothetical protein
MPKELRLYLRNQTVGRESTPWLEPYREAFKKAAGEAALEINPKLRGARKVMALNALISQKLKGPQAPPPV